MRSWGQNTAAKGDWERDGQQQGDTGPQSRDRHRDKKRLNERQQTHPADTQRQAGEVEKRADTEIMLKWGQNQVRIEGEGPSEGFTPRPGRGRAPHVTIRHSPRSTLGGRRAGRQLRQGPAPCVLCWPLLPPAGFGPSTQAGRKVRDKAALRPLFIPSLSLSPTAWPIPSPASSQGTPRARRWCRSLARDFVGTVQQSGVNVLGTGNLGFDDCQVLWVG